MPRRFHMVDVFGQTPLSGNPLAVVVDSGGLDDDEMLRITRWFNLSETTFLLPPADDEADYRVRIFTLAGELPFAGHPTLGTCHVWLDLNDHPGDEIVQECGAGLVRIRPEGDRLAFEAPPLVRDGPVEPADLRAFAHVLGIDPSEVVAANWVDNGPGWVGILLEDSEAVLGLEPDLSRSPGDDPMDIGVAGFCPPDSETLYEVRAFFPGGTNQILEDPATGSLNASLAEWLISEGRANPPYVAGQGTKLGRIGRIHISEGENGSIWVGGNTVTMVEGTLDL